MPGTKKNAGAHNSTLVLTADEYPARTNAICDFRLPTRRNLNLRSTAISCRGYRQLDTSVLGQTNGPTLEDGIEKVISKRP
jgi:hypothetical protein